MSALQYLNALISERLTAAAVEIFGAVERTLEDYQEEMSRAKQEIDLLRTLVLCPEVRSHSPAHQCGPHRCATDASPEWRQEEECVPDVSLDPISVLHIKEEGDQGDGWPELSGVQQSDATAAPPFVEQERKIPNPHQDLDLPQKLIVSSLAHQPQTERIEIPHDRDQPGEQQCTKQNQSSCQGHRGLDPPQTSRYLERSIYDEHHSLSPNHDQILTNQTLNSTEKKRRDANGGQLSGPTTVSPPISFVNQREYGENTEGGVNGAAVSRRRMQNMNLCGDTSNRIGVKERRHSCLVCTKRFKESSHLKNHMRIHTGEKPFHCRQCGRNFRQSGALILHARIHTGERPFQCGVCGRRFGRKGAMETHMLMHKAERP